MPARLTDQDVRIVAALANVDPRTVRRALEGRTKTAAVRAAIVSALRERGFRAEARSLETKGAA